MMNRTTLDSIVPSQHKGRKAKVQISANCYSLDAASKLYEFIKISLSDINRWGEFKPGISFYPKLFSSNGQLLRRNAQTGDLIKIMLPRWQTAARRYDWRKILKMEERLSDNTEIFYMTIVPEVNPETDVPEPAHFLKPESTVTFFVIRDEYKVCLEVYVRNEAVNYQFSGLGSKLHSVMMNVFITGGYYDAQWAKLLNAILKYGMLQMKIKN